ncbi:polysaccharide deacetylase family protein [endosymbiont of Ridgeia piscesae]|jgi:peptidoglycan/xylan/chitin deacetylase (PgdA/CDA1 family)|uniref:Polysaccharide deacetylase n=1 Tax=endosymbiont of Ridgeia piscesae TaxID=54398 RepID=A0A0T5Z4Q3_9GAMM|nr:polysaccharide deacetylase family protein [endosymbiont of Ridgeia piscesae]KRT54694.1 Polysaccharide deacetylase [endosymbiont of Ridgeia piscesae]KRT57723.1 Polysaccharide deacetylase [endosymbiont of Ridgeia piscesae]
MKQRLLKLFLLLGIFRIWALLRRSQITILMIHGTRDADPADAWQPLRPQASVRDMDAALALMKRYFNFISMDDAIAMLKGEKPLKPNSCVLTFDDGYRNNLTDALPLLRKHGIPGLFYPATAHIDQQKVYWIDRLDYILQKADVEGREIQIGGQSVKIDASSRGALLNSYRRIIMGFKQHSESDEAMQHELYALASKLEAEADDSIDQVIDNDRWAALMSWEEIAQASQAPDLLFGSHTVDHVLIGNDRKERVRDQLVNSKAAIEQHTGKPCDHFCYPAGSWDKQAVELLAESGYRSAVTSDFGTNRVGDNPLILKRYPFPNSGSPLNTLAHTSGLIYALSALKQRLRGKAAD